MVRFCYVWLGLIGCIPGPDPIKLFQRRFLRYAGIDQWHQSCDQLWQFVFWRMILLSRVTNSKSHQNQSPITSKINISVYLIIFYRLACAQKGLQDVLFSKIAKSQRDPAIMLVASVIEVSDFVWCLKEDKETQEKGKFFLIVVNLVKKPKSPEAKPRVLYFKKQKCLDGCKCLYRNTDIYEELCMSSSL